jgi:hypothetical protein
MGEGEREIGELDGEIDRDVYRDGERKREKVGLVDVSRERGGHNK